MFGIRKEFWNTRSSKSDRIEYRKFKFKWFSQIDLDLNFSQDLSRVLEQYGLIRKSKREEVLIDNLLRLIYSDFLSYIIVRNKVRPNARMP